MFGRRLRGNSTGRFRNCSTPWGPCRPNFNDRPAVASRAFDQGNRDGFVISAGGGVLVLEERDRAKARGASIYAEIIGYGIVVRRAMTWWRRPAKVRDPLHAGMALDGM